MSTIVHSPVSSLATTAHPPTLPPHTPTTTTHPPTLPPYTPTTTAHPPTTPLLPLVTLLLHTPPTTIHPLTRDPHVHDPSPDNTHSRYLSERITTSLDPPVQASTPTHTPTIQDPRLVSSPTSQRSTLPSHPPWPPSSPLTHRRDTDGPQDSIPRYWDPDRTHNRQVDVSHDLPSPPHGSGSRNGSRNGLLSPFAQLSVSSP